MKNTPPASDDWLNNLPASHADYLSYEKITLGRHPSAFLVYKNETKFIKKIPQSTQEIECSVLMWLDQLQLSSESLFKVPAELRLPKPDLLSSRTDLLITSKLNGKGLTKTNFIAHLSLINKALIYIHNLVNADNLPSQIAQPIKQKLPIEIKDVDCAYHEQFMKAETNIDKSQSVLAFVHGDLSAGNILFNDNNNLANSGLINIGLVDWEYATVRDCRWDLATLAIEFELNTDEFMALCRNYLMQRRKVIDSQEVIESEFIQVAQSWLVVYAITCLSWAKQYDQDTNRYIQFLHQ